MKACRYMSLYVYEEGGEPYVRLSLNDIHADGSEERVTYRLPLQRVEDATDIEDWARQHMAQAIETT